MRAMRPLIWAALFLLAGMPAPGALSVYMDHGAVAARAVLIVEGTVASSESALDPETGRIATYVTLEVSRVLRGPRSLERVVLREPGGSFGGVAHVLDAVPVYVPGEQVVAFLEPSSDGSLRTAGMFFGKYALDADGRTARRDLDGRGLILGRSTLEPEAVSTADLEALAASPRPRMRGNWSASPPEIHRIVREGEEVAGSGPSTLTGDSGPVHLDLSPAGAASARFVTLSSSSPTRWYEADDGIVLTVDVQPGGNPLGDDAAALAEMERAMAAWTGVSESRMALQLGDGNADFTGTHFLSPADRYYSGTNIILFDDPYNDISDPSNCSGVLAIGGYWRSGSTGPPVNGVTYHRALALYVIFSNDFQCILGDPDNLAEVATHELGHGIGLGHSTVSDAIMRSSAYGWGRGPRLGDDDRDGAHCIYPHTLSLTSPAGGETYTVGDTRGVTWTVTAEGGSDPGLVDLEYSADDGATWQPLAAGTANDGYHDWNVEVLPGDLYRVRVVRHNRVVPTPSPWPSACSAAVSPAVFTVDALPLGAVPDGSDGQPLILGRSGGNLTFSWGESGNGAVDDYAIYRGSLDSLRAGTWDHLPETCSAGTDLYEERPEGAGSSFYLVAPLSGGSEGNLGTGSDGLTRPVSASPCGVPE